MENPLDYILKNEKNPWDSDSLVFFQGLYFKA